MRALLVSLALMFGATMASAQQGSIGIYSDTVGVDCNLLDVSPGLTAYYVVHTNTVGSTACRFVAAKPACMTATYLGDAHPFLMTIGNSQTSVSVAYKGCRVGPIHILTINYFTSGTTPACCWYPVTCDPLGTNGCAGGLLDTVDCEYHDAVSTAGFGVINADQSCQCGVPAEESTWGQVKALYEQ
jgi:hypothetical protein